MNALLLSLMLVGLRADLNGDCRVDIKDMAILLEEWMMTDEDCMSNLGDELVVNGDFDSTASWIAGGSWIISGGIATTDQDPGGSLQQDIAIENGKTYQVTYTVSGWTDGDIYVNLNDGYGITRDANGTYTELITPVAGVGTYTGLTFVAGQQIGGYLSIDNVSVREVGITALTDDNEEYTCYINETSKAIQFRFKSTKDNFAIKEYKLLEPEIQDDR